MTAITTLVDWYTTKAQVAGLLVKSDADIPDSVMDISYKWVNGNLGAVNIDYKDTTIHTKLKEEETIELAHLYHVCFMMTRRLAASGNPGRIIQDAPVVSQTFGQGDITMGYDNPDPSEHYKEFGDPTYYQDAQRQLKLFKESRLDDFIMPTASLMSRGNAIYATGSEDYANRHYQRDMRRR